MPAPLAGIRILDLSRLLPGPYATLLLADLGAEVIKLETPRIGDYLRFAPPELGFGGLFELLNRHKQSVALNYRNARGKALFFKLAAQADVIIETFKPGSMAKWGLGYEAVRAVRPDVIYCSLSGYGQNGPYRDRAGHDLNYLALSGLLDMNGAAGGPPLPPGIQIADLAGGMLAAIAILAALTGRERGQGGQYLDVSMLDATLSWMLPVFGSFVLAGQKAERGRLPLGGGLPCYNVYTCADGQALTLAALEPTMWPEFCELLQRPDLRPRQFEAAAIEEVATLFRTRPRAEWLALLAGKEVCVEAVNSFAEAWRDPQVRARGLAQPGAGPLGAIGSLFQFAAPAHPSPAPALGQHTRERLTQVGVSIEELDKLEAEGVIKTAPHSAQSLP